MQDWLNFCYKTFFHLAKSLDNLKTKLYYYILCTMIIKPKKYYIIYVCVFTLRIPQWKKNTLKIKQIIDISYFGVMNQVPKHTNYDISHFFDFNSRSILWTVCVSLLKMCVKCWNVRRVRHFLFELRMPMGVVGWKCVEIIAWCIRII